MKLIAYKKFADWFSYTYCKHGSEFTNCL